MGLDQALTLGHVPGYTIYLRGGVYAGQFDSQITGDDGLPITICSYPGEHAIIDGSLDIHGASTIWRDLEIRYSGWTTRTSSEPGNVPSDLPRRDLNIYGPGTRMINCVIHDMSNVGWWGPAINSEVSGCLIYNNGWDAPDRGHGHGIYTQNRPEGRKELRNCITWGHYSTCGKVYSATNAPLKHYDISGMICGPCGDSRFLIGSDDGSTEDVTVNEHMSFGAALQFGDALVTSSAVFHDCYLVHLTNIPFVLSSFAQLEGVDNVIVGGNGADQSYRVVCKIVNQGDWDIDRNQYFYTGPNVKPFRDEGVADYTFAQWQAATGLDAQSAYTTGTPAQNKLVVQMITPGRSHVAIWNWEMLSSVPAQISGRYVNAFNRGESITLNAGDPLPMDTWSTVAPIGALAPNATTDLRFNCFVVEEL